MTELSSAARAVFEAFNSKFDWVEDGVPGPQFNSIAAALRAAAFQLSFGHATGDGILCEDDLLALAAELEALSND